MIAFKLVKKRKDGSLGPLFINRRQRLPLDEWLQAEPHKTKGYSFRPGWHVMEKPEAPHLSTKGRVWVMVEIFGYKKIVRPKSQGGVWYLANAMRIIKEKSNAT